MISSTMKTRFQQYLISALTRAEKAHVEYERSSTAPKMTWPEFYAQFIARDLSSSDMQITAVTR